MQSTPRDAVGRFAPKCGSASEVSLSDGSPTEKMVKTARESLTIAAQGERFQYNAAIFRMQLNRTPEQLADDERRMRERESGFQALDELYARLESWSGSTDELADEVREHVPERIHLRLVAHALFGDPMRNDRVDNTHPVRILGATRKPGNEYLPTALVEYDRAMTSLAKSKAERLQQSVAQESDTASLSEQQAIREHRTSLESDIRQLNEARSNVLVSAETLWGDVFPMNDMVESIGKNISRRHYADLFAHVAANTAYRHT